MDERVAPGGRDFKKWRSAAHRAAEQAEANRTRRELERLARIRGAIASARREAQSDSIAAIARRRGPAHLLAAIIDIADESGAPEDGRAILGLDMAERNLLISGLRALLRESAGEPEEASIRMLEAKVGSQP